MRLFIRNAVFFYNSVALFANSVLAWQHSFEVPFCCFPSLCRAFLQKYQRKSWCVVTKVVWYSILVLKQCIRYGCQRFGDGWIIVSYCGTDWRVKKRRCSAAFELDQETFHHRAGFGRRENTVGADTFPHGDHLRWGWSIVGSRWTTWWLSFLHFYFSSIFLNRIVKIRNYASLGLHLTLKCF